MIPITRKELYLNKIVGNNDYETPEKPITTEEFFFAEILGEAVQAPEPLTRYQMYLAKIAGREIEIPYPEVRLEYFLAKACGMDIEIPTPITREEIFWSNYTAIVDFEFEGVPPLTYKAIEGTLENYRIYGDTVDGESVGDRTENLFDVSTITLGCYINDEGRIIQNDSINTSDFIKVSPNTNYTYKDAVIYDANIIRIAYYDQSKNFISRYFTPGNAANGETVTTPSNCEYVKLSYDNAITNLMFNLGSTPLTYEPYGYRVPVTVSNGNDSQTIPIYLPEQIKKVGDEAEYIDYGEQKMHRVRVNLFDGEWKQGGVGNIGDFNTSSTRVRTIINVNSGETYTLQTNQKIRMIYAYYYNGTDYTRVQVLLDIAAGVVTATFTIPNNVNTIGVALRNDDNTDITPVDVEWCMLNTGSTALPYEPYIENTDLDVTLPALPTLAGTNVLSVGTAVQPSKVYAKYKGERQ